MYIGIDLGTTALKCVLYDDQGAEKAVFNEEYSLHFDDKRIEQDAGDWWRLSKKGIRFVTEKAGVKEIRALAISTQGISSVPVDREGNPLSLAVTWLDTRAEEEVASLADAFGAEAIFRKTGKPMHACYTLPQMMWFKKHKPALYEKAYKILMPLDFLHMQLCGRPVCDYTIASGTMLFNLSDKDWDKELLSFSGIGREKLPEVVPMGTYIGDVRPAVMEELGLCGSLRVYAGGQDQKLAAIGAGIKPDTATLSLGTAAALSVLAEKRETDVGMRYPSFVLNDTAWIHENSLSTAGAALKWLKSLFGISYMELDALAEKAKPGAGGVRFDSALSESAALSGLTLSTGRGEIVRALYEDIGEKLRGMMENMHAPKNIVVFGGGSKSPIWCRILAEKTGARILAADTAETASRGAVVLASEGLIPPAGIRETYVK